VDRAARRTTVVFANTTIINVDRVGFVNSHNRVIGRTGSIPIRDGRRDRPAAFFLCTRHPDFLASNRMLQQQMAGASGST
jgi:hypothetical protein